MNNRSRNFFNALIPLMALALTCMALPACAYGQQAENQSAREKITALLKRAERLQEQGASDRAEQLVKQAHELEVQLAKATEQRARKKSVGELGEILQGLKAGASSLRALGKFEEAKKLQRLATDLEQREAAGEKPQRGQRERQMAQRQMRTMRLAMQALLDAGREDSADLMEHAIHDLELALEGRRDKQAMEVRNSAPNLGQRTELLMFAAQKLRDAGKMDQANIVAKLGEQMQERFRAQRNRNRQGQRDEARREDGGNERQVAATQIEVMKTALVALREGERKDSADLLNRAIQARVVRLRDLDGEEAKIALEREPKRDQTAKTLGLAAQLWREFGNYQNAATVQRLSRKLATGRQAANRQAAQGERPRLQQQLQQRLKQLENQVATLTQALDKQGKQLKALQQKFNR